MENRCYEGDLNDLYHDTDQDDYIKKIEKHLSEGGDIDVIINKRNEDYPGGTILLHAVRMGLESVVKYTLSKGASVTFACRINLRQSDEAVDKYLYRECNIVEIATMYYAKFPTLRRDVYDTIKEESLKRFSRYGVHTVHFECAVGDLVNILTLAIVEDRSIIDQRINEESPLWAGVTPLLMAAKFNRQEVVKKLLDLGASPGARDSDGCSPLYFAASYKFYDRRLFIYDVEDPNFVNSKGVSHFHLACKFCPDTMDVVKAYLAQGVSPNLSVRETDGMCIDHACTYMKGATGLHVSACVSKDNFYCCPRLAWLLLLYGADVNRGDFQGETALDVCIGTFMSDEEEDNERYALYVCLLIELGASSQDMVEWYRFHNDVVDHPRAILIFVSCVKRILKLSEKLVAPDLLICYQRLLRDVPDHFDENVYGELCKRELRSLSERGIYRQLYDHIDVGLDFNAKFGSLVDNTPDIMRLYPLYGRLLIVRLKRRLKEYEKKKRRLKEALPIMIDLFLGLGNLPLTCAEEILWNLDFEELGDFIKNFTKIVTP